MLGTCLGIAACLAGFNETTLDGFAYADSAAAREAWVAESGSPALEIGADSRPGVGLTLPFASSPQLPRTIHDRRVELDLSAAGEFVLELDASQPTAVGGVSLYFRSGDGWYAGSGRIPGTGRQTLRFPRSSFTIEGSPAGWSRVDGMRLSFWRGEAVDATVQLVSLASRHNDVAVLMPDRAASAEELDSAADAAAAMLAMLAELGVAADALDESSVASGALGPRKLAIVAYHPRLAPPTVAALEAFIRGGGKLFITYVLPDRLAQAMGFGSLRYVRPTRPGQFAEIRLDAADVPGLPTAVRQASWNITDAAPAAGDARIIGRWFDDAGQLTGHAALLLSPRGAFLTHIVLPDDPDGKRQLLAAVLGTLEPSVWREIASSACRRMGRVGHLADFASLEAWIAAAGVPAAAEIWQQAVEKKVEAEAHLARAGAESDPREHVLANTAACAARQLAGRAYLLAQPSPEVEGRAVWNHSGTGAYPGDWERSARELKAAGFNMVFPNSLWAGVAHYASDVLPRSATFREHGDQIAQCVEACKKHGVEVHVWKVNYNLANAPREFVAKLREEGRTQVTVDGQPTDWLCPSHSENRRLELDSLLEVARRYDVDGLHFDYIRYPNEKGCYCAGCRERFEGALGQPVANWPADCHQGPLKDPYRDWRCEQITQLVAEVSREARQVRPGIRISAAVFGAYPDCRRSVGQDWVAWVRAGYLDFVCPMDYTEDDESFRRLVANQLQLVGGRIPVYPGIGVTASRSSLSPDRTAGQIGIARGLGAAGFTIFNFQPDTAAEILPGLSLGATAATARPPHALRGR